MVHPLTQKVDISMNTAGTMESLMNCFTNLSGVEKGLLKSGIGKERSIDGSGSDKMPFLQMLKESLPSMSKNKARTMEKEHLTKKEETDLQDDTVKNVLSLNKEDLNVLFSALTGLAKDGCDKSVGTLFLEEAGGKEHEANLLIHSGLQKGDTDNAILAGRNGREISAQDVKNLINNIVKGFEVGRSGSESGFVSGKAKQEIVDILKGFGFNEKEIEGLQSTDTNESKQNELAARKDTDSARDTGQKLFDVKTGKLSTACQEIVKEFRESQSKHGNAVPFTTGEESEDVKKTTTTLKSNGGERNTIGTINTEMKHNATVPKTGLDTAMAALNAGSKDNPEGMKPKWNVRAGKDSIGTNDKASFLKAVNTQGQGEREGYTKVVNESGIKDVETPTMEDVNKEGRLLHRSGDGNHMTVAPSSTASANATENRSAVDMNPRVVINQVIDAAGEKLTKGFGRIRIELSPPHLGTVDMDVLVRNSKVHVILQTENCDVKHLLQSNTEQLKTSLHTQGLTADTITVSVQEKSDGNHNEYSQSGTLYQEMSDRESDRDDQKKLHNSVADTSSMPPEGESNISPDGRISFFA
ncbi:MAG: flagellar hook-length control protein FliK [Deltaproteobacteria bacterium]|nr:flagellar hook-length control protein FliK [Deltaproteobacteria bacterium]